MPKDDLQQHLDKGMYGTPLINPEEQHKYMGTFRERCYLTMTVAEMKNAQHHQHLLTELTKHPDAFVLLNGSISSELQGTYVKLLNDQATKFTIVNNFVENAPDAFGLIVAAKEAVDEPVIDIDQKYPQLAKTQSEVPKPKKNFWQRLFH
ncbi:YueI family protein [Enterococcus faecalis]